MTDDQKRAGRAVMKGLFSSDDVMRALHRAGISALDAMDAAAALLIEEVDAKRIRRSEGKWMKI